jgi:hypothetical protein
MDPRLKILMDPSPEEIKSCLLSHYLPPLAGNLATVSLQNRVGIDKRRFQQAANAIGEVIGQIADDYTVQSRFGKKWIINTLANLPKASQATQTLSPRRKILITGAGPSLEDQIAGIRSKKTEGYLIASDTSLPTLLANGIKPDLVVSIDCQQVSYHHFLSGYPEDVPLVLDLASPPILATLTDRLIFFSSGHPFSQYVSSHFRHFPRIDTSGGNVSHAAVSLAGALGAEEITLFGIDFSFPEGKSYARGTYFYPYFRSQESRLEPMETHNFSFLLLNRHIVKEKTGRNIRYTTKPMISYKSRLEEAIRTLGVRVDQAPGKGVVLDIPSDASSETSRSAFPTMFSQGASKTDWREFLKHYWEQLQNLPCPQEPLGRSWNELSAEAKVLWMTMLPAATAIKEEIPESDLTAVQLLAKTKAWTCHQLEKRIAFPTR